MNPLFLKAFGALLIGAGAGLLLKKPQPEKAESKPEKLQAKETPRETVKDEPKPAETKPDEIDDDKNSGLHSVDQLDDVDDLGADQSPDDVPD